VQQGTSHSSGFSRSAERPQCEMGMDVLCSLN
jgi:hypothetical protein